MTRAGKPGEDTHSVFTDIRTYWEWVFLMTGTKPLVLCWVGLQARIHIFCGGGGSVILPVNPIACSLDLEGSFFKKKSFLEEEVY